jgi:cytochrome c
MRIVRALLCASGAAATLLLAACGEDRDRAVPAEPGSNGQANVLLPTAENRDVAADVSARSSPPDVSDVAPNQLKSENLASPPAAPVPGTPALTAAPRPPVAGVAVPASFAQCAVCHSVASGAHKIGPSLFGIAGARAASKPGFAYSPALTESDLRWSPDTLDKFLENPRAVVPGTKMIYPGVKDAAKRRELIDYLGTVK